MAIAEVSWTLLYVEVAQHLHVKKQHVIDLHQHLIKDGDVLVFGQGKGSKRGPKAMVHQQSHNQQEQSIVDMVETITMPTVKQ
jgi:hypothetical protein